MKTTLITLAAIACLQVPLLAKDIAVSELPKVVSEAVTKAYPNAKLLSAEEDLDDKGKLEYYEVTIRDGTKQMEVKVAPDGKILKAKKDD